MAPDLQVWLVAIIFLVLLGLRAWLVETSPASGGSGRDVRVVTAAVGVALAVLILVVALRGGLDLASLLRNPPPQVPAQVPVPVPPAVPLPTPVPVR